MWFCSVALLWALALSLVFTRTTCSSGSRPEDVRKSGLLCASKGMPVRLPPELVERVKPLVLTFVQQALTLADRGVDAQAQDCTPAVRTVGVYLSVLHSAAKGAAACCFVCLAAAAAARTCRSVPALCCLDTWCWCCSWWCFHCSACKQCAQRHMGSMHMSLREHCMTSIII